MGYAFRGTVFALLAAVSLSAQRGGAGSSGGNSGGNTAAPPASSTPSQSSQPTQQSNPGVIPQPQMPVFISGRVMMDDGSPPPGGVGIQRLCANTPRTVAFTNLKGQFSFQWGQSAGIIPDASEGGGINGGRSAGDMGTSSLSGSPVSGSGGPNMLGCELIVNAAGFRSDRVDLSSRRASDNPDIGTIFLHRIAGVEGTSVSATSLNAPKDARKAWEKGVQLLHKSKGADAERELRKAVDIYPKYASAWLDLGRARLQQKETAAARDAFLKAIELDGKLVEPYVELGEQSAREAKWPEAVKNLDRALQLDPVDYPRLWFENAVAHFNMHDYDQAEKNTRAALKLNPPNRDPHANQLLGLILINKRDYAGAGDALRAYVKLSPNAKDLDQVKAQIARIDVQLGAARP
ncbi:MAG TPA: tetratricopeptide repeat protein [Bryobacteraceae bacterium]|nr:tetratricopeptide repeat protein [Bryobacteraceae bacterium]